MMSVTKKAIPTLALLVVLGAGVAGCVSNSTPDEPAATASSAPQETQEAPQPVGLTGEWKQSNANSPDSFQTATITGDTLEVYWNATDSKSLYWAGTVEVPGDGIDSFTWDSVNDKEKTRSALMASGEDTKTFTYRDGELSYEVSAMGNTMTVRLAKE